MTISLEGWSTNNNSIKLSFRLRRYPELVGTSLVHRKRFCEFFGDLVRIHRYLGSLRFSSKWSRVVRVKEEPAVARGALINHPNLRRQLAKVPSQRMNNAMGKLENRSLL